MARALLRPMLLSLMMALAAITQRQAEGLSALMDLADNDLLDLLLARKEPQGEVDTAAVREVLALMRRPPLVHQN